MTLPSRPSRPRWRRAPVVVSVLAVTAVAVGLAAWVDQLSTPVVRTGVPTAMVGFPKPTPEPTPTPTATPTLTGPGASPSSTPSADLFATSTAERPSTSGVGTLRRFIVKVEKAGGLAADEVAAEIAATLNDPRGWAGGGAVQFELVDDPKNADFTIYVSAPGVADAACDQSAAVCVQGEKVVLNAAGWKTPATPWGDDLAGFRRYLVNNAVGNYLGEAQASCTEPGQPAPVMAAQTGDLKGCTPNPWP